MDKQTGQWFEHMLLWLKYLDQKIDLLKPSGNPVADAKIDALKKVVDAKSAEMQKVVNENQP